MLDYKLQIYTQSHQWRNKIENQWQPLLQRKKDVFLMNAYSKFTKDTHTLKIMNNCRIHLRIITLSDITSADGKKLVKTQLYGHQSPSFMSELV